MSNKFFIDFDIFEKYADFKNYLSDYETRHCAHYVQGLIQAYIHSAMRYWAQRFLRPNSKVLCKLFDRSFNLLTLTEKTLDNHPMSTEKRKTALITS